MLHLWRKLLFTNMHTIYMKPRNAEAQTDVWKELMVPNSGVYTQLFVVKHFWLVYTMMNLLRTCFYRMMCINVLNSMIATEVLNDETKCSHKIITESTFTRSIREAHAWDRYGWHHRPLCKRIIHDIQTRQLNIEVMTVFLSVVQESQELLSALRHLMRGEGKIGE